MGRCLSCSRSKLTHPEYVVVTGKTVRSERQSKRTEEKKVRAQRGDGSRASLLFVCKRMDDRSIW